MAILITSGNLNTLGNAGNFETDPSTWGFGGGFLFSISRSNLYSSKDSYSCKCVVNDEGDGFGTCNSYAKAKWTPEIGKRYFIKAKIFTTAALSPSGLSEFFLEYETVGLSFINSVNQPVADFTGAWKQLEVYVECTMVGTGVHEVNVRDGLADGSQFPNCVTFVDEFEIYEYIDVVAPCTLVLNAAGTVVTNETAPGANDGSITVAITGGTGPFEYSKDGGATWQPGNAFAGLAPAVYNIVVREAARIGCNSTQTFTVNAFAYSCTLVLDAAGTVVTNESVPGAHDGSITVATIGGTGPFEYSNDGGATWQPGNVFGGLAPAIYTVVVRETSHIGCNSTQVFSVNAYDYAFSFTTSKNDETILGAEDGSITITVTGAVAPFTYSDDGGASYQGSNIFTDLPPGVYTIVVKDNGGITRATNVTILAGAVLFDKVWHNRNPVTLAMNAPAGWDAIDNFKLYDDVRVEEVAGSGVFVSEMITALTPFSDGTVTFQVSEAFRDVLKIVVDMTDDIIRLTDRIKFFKHYTGQISGTSDVPGALTPSFPHLVILGGISKEKFPTQNFFSTLHTTKKFFSWAPLTKLVDRQQPDFLTYFIFGLTTTTLKLQVKAYYDDETNETAITFTKAGVAYGQLYQMPAGPVNSGAILIDPTKNLVAYDISLLNQHDSLISEVRSYVLDPISHPRKRYFMFLNSLGAFEVMRFTGVAVHQTEVIKDEVVKYLPLGYNATDGEIEVNNANFRDAHSFSTGNDLTKDWQNYLKDLLISKRVYQIDNGNVHPIVVSAATYSLDEDQNYDRFIRFTAKDAFIEESYTP
jgi:guanyl-specific ribonuclease Sa